MSVEPGMTKRQVKRLLGKPHGRINERQYLRDSKKRGTHIMSVGGIRNDDHWIYFNTPSGYDTQIVFKGRRVAEVSTPPARR